MIYLVPMWGGLTRKESETIQRLMNRAARVVTGLARKTRTRTLMVTCNWLYFEELINFHSILALWKLLKTNTPYHLSTKFSMNEELKASTTIGHIKLTRNAFRWKSVQL